MTNLITTPLFESCMYIMAVYGVYLLFSTLKFFDISTDNVFAFGSIAGAFVLIETESLVLAFIAIIILGFVVGSFTSVLYSSLKVPKLLAGIITYSILFSINIKFFHKPNISFSNDLYETSLIPYLIIGFDLFIFSFLVFLFKTKIGKSLITIGSNPKLITEFGGRHNLLLLLGVGLGNALIATSGFMTSLYYGFSDVNMGVGILINSVAGIIIAESIMSHFNKKYRFIIIFLGIVIYNFLLFLVISYLSFGFLDFSDYKLISGLIIILFFIFNRKQLSEVMSLN